MRWIVLGALALACAAQPLTREQENDLRSKIRAALFVPERLPPLAAKVHGAFRPAPGVVAERIGYNTLLGLRVPAILYRPREKDRLICESWVPAARAELRP